MRLLFASITSAILCVLSSVNAFAMPVVVPPPSQPAPQKPPVVITSFGGSKVLEFAELYNQLDLPVNVTGWRVVFTIRDAEQPDFSKVFELPVLTGWLLPEKYASYQRDTSDVVSVPFAFDETELREFIAPQLIEIKLLDDKQTIKQAVKLTEPLLGQWAQHKQRGKATLTDNGVMPKDYRLKTDTAEIYSEPLYLPAPTTAGLAIVEVLANPRYCGPIEQAVECGDYIKVYNSSNVPINLADYRLRTGYRHQNATLTNTFTWGRQLADDEELLLPAGAYMAVAVQNDTSLQKYQPMELTNGGYVWLEDKIGVTIYDSTVIAYPELNKGVSWARDTVASKWRTGEPRPHGANVYIKAQAPAAHKTAACKSGYLRHPETKRCRKIGTVTTLTSACKSGQTRNPETNRCRSVVSATSGPTPCKPGYERNPETNRCRSLASKENAPAPCKSGQERNSETNRCRKITTSQHTAATINNQEAAKPESMIGWGVGGVVAAGALGYAAYEWRQPILGGLRRVGGIFRRPPTE